MLWSSYVAAMHARVWACTIQVLCACMACVTRAGEWVPQGAAARVAVRVPAAGCFGGSGAPPSCLQPPGLRVRGQQRGGHPALQVSCFLVSTFPPYR